MKFTIAFAFTRFFYESVNFYTSFFLDEVVAPDLNENIGAFNLVPRAFPLKVREAGKDPGHVSILHPKILGVIN